FNQCIISNVDTPISINVLLTELVLVGILTYTLYRAYKVAPTSTDAFGILVENGLLRIICLVPLGIMEAIDYYMEYLRGNGVRINTL
ncbi:hypothetical protein HDV06_004002, partial [Boothiomyces sp. JEL0866]